MDLKAVVSPHRDHNGLAFMGPVTGWPYEVTSTRGMARYALEVFRLTCVLGEAAWPSGLHVLTAEEVLQRWIPPEVWIGFTSIGVQPQLLAAIERELRRQCHLACGTGGAAMDPESYVAGEVDEILVEKALDVLVDLDAQFTFDPDGYADAVEGESWALVDQCMRILHTYGSQLAAEGLPMLVAGFADWTRSGKYACPPQTRRVVSSALNEAWDGLLGWKA